MANNSLKKNVMLTLTPDEAKEITTFQHNSPYISLAKYIKSLLLTDIRENEKNRKKNNPQKASQHNEIF